MKEIYLFPGQWAYSREPAEIATILGSCVAVALHDRELKTGALNHYLLPKLPQNEAPSPRYGSVAIPRMIEAMLQDGSQISSLAAKIYGGGNVLSGVSFGNIGGSNIEMAVKILQDYGIPVVDRNVGGTQGRKIALFTNTFHVDHKLHGSEKSPLDTTGFGYFESLKTPRIAIVDDSATVRSLFQKIFKQKGIKVVGTAANAYEARALIVKERPDAITLDLEMPRMNGITFLEKLMQYMPIPVVIVSSLGSQGEAAARALELGAVEFVHKPSQFDPTVLRDLAESLVHKVRAAASVDPERLRSRPERSSSPIVANALSTKPESRAFEAIVIGGNAGSTEALRTILESLSEDTPPVVVANATVAPFLESYLSQMKRRVRVALSIAKEGDLIRTGHVYFAPGDSQVRLARVDASWGIHMSGGGPPVCGQRPSSSVLFESATALAPGVLAVLLGGFGSDGIDGLEKIRAHGGLTIVQNPQDSPFPYAPQKAIAIGVADEVLKAGEIANAIVHHRNQRVAA